MPHHIMLNDFKGKNNLFGLFWINLVLTISVCLKNLIHHYKIIYDLFIYIGIIFGSSFVFWIYLLCINDKLRENETQDNSEIKESCINNSNEDKKYVGSYVCGYLMIRNDINFIILIKIQGFCQYFFSVLSNGKILLIIFINFFSRIQKIKFKLEFKNNFREDNNLNIFLLILNFFISFLIVYLFQVIFFCKKINLDLMLQKREKFILKFIGIDNIGVSLFSLLNYFYNWKALNWISICLSGSINFLFYEYYSNKEIDYVSMSGFVSLFQSIFRLIDENIGKILIDDFWFLIQIIPSVLSIFLIGIYLVYYCKCCKNCSCCS